MSSKTFRVVSNQTRSNVPVSPERLGREGRALWDRVHREYLIEDAGGITLLELACRAADRAAECRAKIDKDGLTVETGKGVYPHPLLKHELQAQAFIARTLQRLALDLEPIRSPGRPPGAA